MERVHSACRACGRNEEAYMQHSDLKFPTDLGLDVRVIRKLSLRGVIR